MTAQTHEVIHLQSLYGRPVRIACGATGPVRVTNVYRETTCADCVTADIGPKPPSTPRPTPGPGPSGPPRPTRGHLPIGAEYARPPRLGEVIRDAERLLRQAMTVLEGQWDPTSGPQQDGGVHPSDVDRTLGAARTEVRVALLHLGDVAELGLWPAGSAVPQTTGGVAGERLSPGYAARPSQAVRESDGAATPTQATSHPLLRAGAQRADTPARTIGAPAAMVEAPGTREGGPGAGVHSWARPLGLYVWPGTEEIAERVAHALARPANPRPATPSRPSAPRPQRPIGTPPYGPRPS